MKWLELIKFLTPIILTAINPHLAQIAPSIVEGISEAEKLKNSPGSTEKLQHAVAIANHAVTAINAGTGKNLINPEIVSVAVPEAISTIVDVVNILHKSPANIDKGV